MANVLVASKPVSRKKEKAKTDETRRARRGMTTRSSLSILTTIPGNR